MQGLDRSTYCFNSGREGNFKAQCTEKNHYVLIVVNEGHRIGESVEWDL